VAGPILPGAESRFNRDTGGKEADMGKVDVQRAFRSMSLPAPSGEPHEWPSPNPIADAEPAPGSVARERDALECADVEAPSEQEQDAHVREAVAWLGHVLEPGPQPLRLVLDLFECRFDLSPGCAERLFWQVQERGYVSLREGRVYLSRSSSGP
jgi:hypothetical protein